MNNLPQTVGRYRLITRLGQGGMATAYLAMSRGPGGFRKLSVVKQLLPELRHEREFVAMFLDEARIAALFRHPNVVQTHEIVANGDLPFMAMEYLEGQTFTRARRYLDCELHIRVICEALAGLHYVHELTDLSGRPMHVVHRDISPSNLFVTYDGAVKILDFGIAKAAGGNVKTKTGGFKGKLSYVAPEQARTSKVDRRADIFAVGVLLWEAIAGRSMVPRDQGEAMTFQNRLTGNEPSIDDVAPDAPRALREICKKAMALDRDDRYQTALEFREALAEAVSGLSAGPSAELAGIMAWRFRAERQTIGDEIARAITSDGASDAAIAAPGPAGLPPAAPAARPAAASSTVPPLSASSQSVDRGWLAQASSRPSRSARSTVPPTRTPSLSPSVDGRRGGGAIMSLLGLIVVVGGWSYRLLPSLLAPDPQVEQTSAAPAAAPVEAPAAPGAEAAAPSAKSLEQGPNPAQLTITVEPDDATVVLDGEELDKLPFVSRGSVDRGKHYVVASAPGYETAWRRFRLDDDLELEIELERLPSWTSDKLTDSDEPEPSSEDDDRDESDGRDGSSRDEVAKKDSERRARDAREREQKRRAAQRQAAQRERERSAERKRERRAARRSREQARRPDRTSNRRAKDDKQAEERREKERRERERREQATAEREERKSEKSDDARSDSGGRMRPGQSLRRVRKKSRTIDKDNPYQ